MILRLRLPPAVRRAILDHARRELPNECCGFLIGRGSRVQYSYPTRNVGRTPAHAFRIDDAEHIALRRTLRGMTPALEIVGVYHSHPSGPARPSPRDIREAHYPDWVHVIVGLSTARPVIRAYRLDPRRR